MCPSSPKPVQGPSAAEIAQQRVAEEARITAERQVEEDKARSEASSADILRRRSRAGLLGPQGALGVAESTLGTASSL